MTTQNTTRVRGKHSPETVKQASESLEEAFQILGLVGPAGLVCPACGTGKRHKVVAKVSRNTGNLYFKCHKCGENGDAISLLVNYGNYTFSNAVSALTGEAPEGAHSYTGPRWTIPDSFHAKCDPVVYDHLIQSSHVSLEKAQQYYAQWHISAEAVAEAGSRYVVDGDSLTKELIGEYGEEHLTDTGLLLLGRDNKKRLICTGSYRVLEPHVSPGGHVFGLQMRPVGKVLARVQAHKAAKASGDPAMLEANEYVPGFLTLKGSTTEHQIGCGLFHLGHIPDGSEVHVVEGFKDLLAARTMGMEAYALPGAGTTPPTVVQKFFLKKKFTLILDLDGDQAGQEGRERLSEELKDSGIPTRMGQMPENLDMADILAVKHQEHGCSCAVR